MYSVYIQPYSLVNLHIFSIILFFVDCFEDISIYFVSFSASDCSSKGSSLRQLFRRLYVFIIGIMMLQNHIY